MGGKFIASYLKFIWEISMPTLYLGCIFLKEYINYNYKILYQSSFYNNTGLKLLIILEVTWK